MQKFIVLFLSLIVLSNCKNTGGTTISGTIKGAQQLEGTLDETMLRQNLTLAKVKFENDGKFSVNIPEGMKAGLYRIKVGVKQINLISDGTEKNIVISADLATLDKTNYGVEGSEDTKTYIKTFNDVISQQKKLPELQKTIEEAKNPMLSMLMMMQVQAFAGPEYLDFRKKIAERMTAAYPNSSYTTDFNQIVKGLEKPEPAVAETNIAVGQIAPEIALPNPSGKIMKLSDLKGKVVLLDFWASWCGPCRAANPSVVRMYNQFKGKGFEVYSVSLDKTKEAWKSAIQQDGLIWQNHVSDLKYWQSEAAGIYNVSAIPQQFLLDRNGKIAVIAQPGSSIEQQIEKLVN